MMRFKNYFFLFTLIGLICVQNLFVGEVNASDKNNNYDPVEQIFTIPNTIELVTYVLPALEVGESYMVKTLGAIKVNEINQKIGEINENQITTNEFKIAWDIEEENRAISVYKFKDGNAIMAMGRGGEGYCGNGYINLEIPISELCPYDWVKVVWHRNTSCDNKTNTGCANGEVLWKIKGITEYSTKACGGVPDVNDPLTYGNTGNYGPINQQNICNVNVLTDCKEIYIKAAMVRDLEITAEAVDCGTPPFGCDLSATKSYSTGFWFDPILNQPYPDPSISISGNATLPCQGQNSVYTLNGISHYSSSLPLTITWTLTNNNWAIVSGQNSSAVTINTNGNPGNAVLRARIDTYDPFDCNRTYYIENSL
ncbi:MAG: hypothetical protein RLN79_15395 [Cytophagales bacterium]